MARKADNAACQEAVRDAKRQTRRGRNVSSMSANTRIKSSVRGTRREPEARDADGGPKITRRKPVNTPVITSSQDQATCNRTLTPS